MKSSAYCVLISQNGQIAERALLSGDIEINEPPDVYIPFQLDPNSAEHGHYFNVAGRLKPGVTLAAANAQLQASYQEYARKWPDPSPGAGFGVRRLQDAIVGGVRNSLLILFGAVSFVLLIACANVANLLLARATGRKREIAIRAALGAGRGRIVRQLLTESMMLSLDGGGMGLAAGYAGIRAVLRLSPGIPRIGAGGSNVELDWRVLGFTLALSMLTAILFGLFPALQSSRADLGAALKESREPQRYGCATQSDAGAAGDHRDGAGRRAVDRGGAADPNLHRDPASESRLRCTQCPDDAHVAHGAAVRRCRRSGNE